MTAAAIRPSARTAAGIAVLLSLLAGSAAAQSDPQEGLPPGSWDPHDYRVRALRVERSPIVDGRLDEPVWQRAEPATGFTQRNPDEGVPATERTEIRILYTRGVLYIGARMYDSRPEELVATAMRRDSRLHDDDFLAIMLDTFHDHRNAFAFHVNPAGARWDAYITDEGRDVNSDFNVVWEAATEVDEQGWVAELAIPLSQLRFSGVAGPQQWGINFQRNIRRKNEEVFWVPVPRDYGMRGFNRMSNAGVLTGLNDLPVGAHIQFKPYALGGGALRRDLDEAVADWDDSRVTDMGLDMKYGITSNMTLDLTFNTDFAQVEADQERVNLDRFPLFFPEKRDFFLEGAGIFGGSGGMRYGGGPDLQLFYSRRIGLATTGEEVPILGGGKLTGRTGPWTVGLLDVFTREKTLSDGTVQEATNWSVLSLRRNVLSRSSVGLLAMSKDPQTGDYNRTVGVDANLQLSDYSSFRTQYARVWDPAIGGDPSAFTSELSYDTDFFDLRAEHRKVGPDFEAEMGFIRRRGLRETSMEAEVSPRPGFWGIRQTSLALEGSYLTDPSGRLLTRQIGLRNFTFMENTSNFFLTLQRTYDVVEQAFEVGGTDVEVAAGAYENNSLNLRGGTDGRRKLGLRGGLNAGGYFDGHRLGGNANLTYQPSANLNASIGLSRNAVWDLGPDDAGHLETNVWSLRVNYAFSPGLFTKAFIQYNDVRNALISNYLLHWILRDGTELFLVYNEAYDTMPEPGGPRFDPSATDRTLLLKFTYLILW